MHKEKDSTITQEMKELTDQDSENMKIHWTITNKLRSAQGLI